MSNINLKNINAWSSIGTTQPLFQSAETEILSTYGDIVSVSKKAKSLRKFGQNRALATGVKELISEQGGMEILPSSNLINEVVSTDASDTQEIKIEGHILNGSDFTFVIQTVTLTGTTPVSITPMARASRLINNNATDFAGTITVYQSIAGTIHLKVAGTLGENQSLKCATTISSVDYWIVTGLIASVNKGNAAKVDFEFQYKELGKTWRTISLPFTVESGNTSVQSIEGEYFIIPKNYDVRIVATASLANTRASAEIVGKLAIIV